eukprot:532786_1
MTVIWMIYKIWIFIKDINIYALQKWMAHNLLKFCMAFKLLQCVVAIQVILVSLIDECIVVPVIECTVVYVQGIDVIVDNIFVYCRQQLSLLSTEHFNDGDDSAANCNCFWMKIISLLHLIWLQLNMVAAKMKMKMSVGEPYTLVSQ